MGDKVYFYNFAIVVIAIAILVMWFVTRTPFGGIMLGVRENHSR